MMIMLNELEKQDSVTKEEYRILLTLLNPYIPHITEELNEQYALGNVLCESTWPEYDDSKTMDEEFTLVVQVNGKVRGKITVSSSTTEEEMKAKAFEIENVKTYIEGKEIVKVIAIPKKLVSIVVK